MPTVHRRHALAYLGALAWGAHSPAALAQRTLGKIVFPAQMQVAGQALVFNGAGIRYKAVFQVYALGLYLEQPATTVEEACAPRGCKRLAATMLRDVNASELGNMFTKGILDNNPTTTTTQLLPTIARIGDVFSRFKRLQAGDPFMVDRLPGKGMVLTVKGEAQHEPFEEAFFDALLNMWLGPKPADQQLKVALLGG